MSIFGTIIKDIKSAAAKIEAAFKKLFNEAPSWVAIANGTLTYLGPIVVTILDIGGGPALGAEANNIIANIKTDLATASAIVGSVNAATILESLLKGIEAQLPALLTAVKVSNPASAAEIENYVNIIGTELTALLEALPGVPAPTGPNAVAAE